MSSIASQIPAPGTPDGRADERTRVEAFVKVQGGEREYVFRTRDLSMGGLFLYSKVVHSYPFQVGSRLALELYDYDQFVRCTVVVARLVEPHSAEADQYPSGFGVRIVEIPAADRQRLAEMLTRARAGTPPY